VLRRVQTVVQPLLERLSAARAAHEPLTIIDSQCNVHTTICVQYQVGATAGSAAQAGSDTETLILKNTKFDIKAQGFNIVYSNSTDIEGAIVDIDKSSISGYEYIEVLNFESSISMFLRYCTASKFQATISKIFRY
jgi:hypothetical protein